jgi:hypothetical protein
VTSAENIDRRPRAGRARAVLRFALRAVAIFAVLIACGWAALALSIDGPGTVFAVVFLIASAFLLFVRKRRRLARAGWLAIFLAILVWWFSIEPSNDREWQPDVARAPAARVEGDRLTIANVRNFRWTSETAGVPAWEDRTYDLSKIVGVDLYMCDWGAKGIVHTITSFEFADGPPLAISIETRKESTEGYSAVRGLFRQFELIYVVADERDLVGVRVKYRGERVRLYRLNIDRERARDFLLAYVRQIDRLSHEPTWYNAATSNCTTLIRMNAMAAGGAVPWDWRFLANGHLDEVFYERGRIDTSMPFDEMRRRSDVTDEALASLDSPDFSERIRVGLPARH